MQTCESSLLPSATSRFESAVFVTTERSVLPIVLDFALSKYGGNSSKRIKSFSLFRRLTQAVLPGACNGA